MKKIENSFVVSGFVGKDASIHQFSTASVARFSLAISRNFVKFLSLRIVKSGASFEDSSSFRRSHLSVR